jgi:arginine deiminase
MGLSERSSPGAFDVMAEQLVRQQGVTDILVVVLPTDRAMIHLDMIFTMIDHEHCVVFPPNFIGPTRSPVLHYRAGKKGMREMPNLFAALRSSTCRSSRCSAAGRADRQEREQWSSGCNFVAVRPGLILGYSRNEATYAELEKQAGYRIVNGIDFLTATRRSRRMRGGSVVFEGGELVRGGGGGRCMTLPVRREAYGAQLEFLERAAVGAAGGCERSQPRHPASR